MEALASAKSVYIKQNMEFGEMITGYETPNTYEVYFKSPGDPNYTSLFVAKEMSDYCERNCMSWDSRPLIMKIKHYSTDMDKDFNHDTFAVF